MCKSQCSLIGSLDGSLTVWDVGNTIPTKLYEMRSSDKAVAGIAFTESGDQMFVGSEDGRLSLYRSVPSTNISGYALKRVRLSLSEQQCWFCDH